jgi:hypothetical protein
MSLEAHPERSLVEHAHGVAEAAAGFGKDRTKDEYATGGLDRQLSVSRYLVALPETAAISRLIETDRAAWEQNHATPPEAKRSRSAPRKRTP